MMLDFSRKKCLLHGRLESRWQVASKVELMMLDFMGMKLQESREVRKTVNSRHREKNHPVLADLFFALVFFRSIIFFL